MSDTCSWMHYSFNRIVYGTHFSNWYRKLKRGRFCCHKNKALLQQHIDYKIFISLLIGGQYVGYKMVPVGITLPLERYFNYNFMHGFEVNHLTTAIQIDPTVKYCFWKYFSDITAKY